MPSVGAELASVPFGKMIYDMAFAIAKSQSALDMASCNLVKVLANSYFSYVPDVVETLLPNPRQAKGPNGEGLVDDEGNPVIITGVVVQSDVGPAFPLSLLQAGVNPTFYQFTNSTITVKISITSTSEVDTSISWSSSFQGQINSDQVWSSGSYSSHVNASFSGKYSYSVTGSSSLSTTLAVVPPPKAMMPRFFLINAMDPSKISISQS
jgi:hypothetical protein